MFQLKKEEEKIFNTLKTPAHIQDFLNILPYNFTEDTCMAPRAVLQKNAAHCLEGACLAAAVLWYHGEKPLLLDLKSTKTDLDHVVALFKRNDCWGAISKTNHAVLRYREPIYRTVRELALSYFHEYFLEDGTKTMRSFSKPFSLISYGTSWLTDEEGLWQIGADLDDSTHTSILPKDMHARNLRKADAIEIQAGAIIQF